MTAPRSAAGRPSPAAVACRTRSNRRCPGSRGKRSKRPARAARMPACTRIAQVAHFDTDVDRPLECLDQGHQRAARTKHCRDTGPSGGARNSTRVFPPRGGAMSTGCSAGPTVPVLLSGRAGWTHRRARRGRNERGRPLLDSASMISARSAPPSARRKRRSKRHARSRHAARRGDLIRFEFAADAFLQHMVRNIVGSLVYVGSGQPAGRLDWRSSRKPRSHPRRADVCAGRTLPCGGRVRCRLGDARRSGRRAHRGHRSGGLFSGRPSDPHGHSGKNLRHHPRRGCTCRGARRRARDWAHFLPEKPAPGRRCGRGGSRRGAAALRDAGGVVRGSARPQRCGGCIDGVRPQLLQFHGDETAEFCAAIRRCPTSRRYG